MFHYIE